MHIDHIALWTPDLDRCTGFYARYFDVTVGAKYVNAATGFTSRFLTFADGARIEVMTKATLPPADATPGVARVGYAHVAIAVGSEQRVDELCGKLKSAGVPILDGPRRTGDGYYECVVLDPDGNRIEITGQCVESSA
jgi:lactoylglutathione lyase